MVPARTALLIFAGVVDKIMSPTFSNSVFNLFIPDHSALDDALTIFTQSTVGPFRFRL
jgi:hypothetical protein